MTCVYLMQKQLRLPDYIFLHVHTSVYSIQSNMKQQRSLLLLILFSFSLVLLCHSHFSSNSQLVGEGTVLGNNLNFPLQCARRQLKDCKDHPLGKHEDYTVMCGKDNGGKDKCFFWVPLKIENILGLATFGCCYTTFDFEDIHPRERKLEALIAKMKKANPGWDKPGFARIPIPGT